MTAGAGPVAPVADGVRVAVRLTPGASRAGIAGLATDEAGGVWLKATVTAVPEAGRANAALIKLLAREWRLPKGAFTLASGATGRRKVLHVAGDPKALSERIGAAIHGISDRLEGGDP